LAAVALPWTSLGELTALPSPLTGFREGPQERFGDVVQRNKKRGMLLA